jgi:vesicle-associated membrane protein 7
MNNEFSPVLQGRMKHYNTISATGAPLSAVQGKLETVKGVMVQNIEMILGRGEKLELLVDKTDALQTQAFQFQKTSKKLRHAMFMRKVKLYAAIALSVAVVVWIISAVACGIDYSKCRAKSNDDDKSKSKKDDDDGGDKNDDDKNDRASDKTSYSSSASYGSAS